MTAALEYVWARAYALLDNPQISTVLEHLGCTSSTPLEITIILSPHGDVTNAPIVTTSLLQPPALRAQLANVLATSVLQAGYGIDDVADVVSADLFAALAPPLAKEPPQ